MDYVNKKLGGLYENIIFAIPEDVRNENRKIFMKYITQYGDNKCKNNNNESDENNENNESDKNNESDNENNEKEKCNREFNREFYGDY